MTEDPGGRLEAPATRYGVAWSKLHQCYCLTIGGELAVRYGSREDALRAYRLYAGKIHPLESKAEGSSGDG